MRFLAILLFIASCCGAAHGVTLSFDDITPGNYPSNPYHINFSSQFAVSNHSGSTWGLPHSGANVLVNTWGGPLDSAMIKFWYWDSEWNQIEPTLHSFGAYFSTEQGVVLSIIGYRTNGEMLTAPVGAMGESWSNRWVELSTLADDLKLIYFQPVTPNALFHYCADDLTVVFAPEPMSLIALAGALAAFATRAKIRK